MKCPDCQEGLTQVPTSHGPGLNVCSSGHGLWLDVGEVNFFVEDYTSLKRFRWRTNHPSAKSQNPLYIGSHRDHAFIISDRSEKTCCPTCNGKYGRMEQ